MAINFINGSTTGIDAASFDETPLTKINVDGVCIWTGTGYFIFTLLDDGTYSVKAASKITIPEYLEIPGTYNGVTVSTIDKNGFNPHYPIASGRPHLYKTKGLVINEGITTISDYAFVHLLDLEYVVLPKSLTSVGQEAFWDLQNLTAVYYRGSAESWDDISFGWYNFEPEPIRYYYSETQPVGQGNYWHYVDGEPTIWENLCGEGHTYECIKAESSCTEAGEATYKCSECGHTYTETIPATGHSWSDYVYSEKICTTDGTQTRSCSVCGVTETEEVLALGHDWSDWDIYLEPTCTTKGSKRRKCSRCSVYNTVAIEATGHDWDTDVIVVKPTYTEQGYTLHTCNYCGETYKDNYTDPLLTFRLLSVNSYSVRATNQDISGEIEIPSTYNGLPVTHIEDAAFWYCANIEGVTIPDSVQSIGNNAFSYCDKLAYVNVGENSELDSIGSQAFMECYMLTDITNLLANVTGIHNETFQSCSKLPNVTFNPDLDEIGDRAFDDCDNITGIHIPANVGFIGEDAFRGCRRLTSITVDAANTTYHSKNNCLIETETNTIILGCANSEIPRTVASIGGGAFNGRTYFAPIRIPLSVMEIKPLAFKGGENLTILCEASSKPVGWADNWNDGSATVVWGYEDDKEDIFYGVSKIPESYNSAFILGLQNRTAANEHLSSITATPLEDEYIYYCVPATFGDCTFAYNNFVGGFSKTVEGIGFTNENGATKIYNIYKSNQANLGVSGAITITIKGTG